MEFFDVIIIGAGPAGSTLARLVSGIAGLKTALIDARSLDCAYAGTGRIKSCGGLMAPDAQKALACLDMDLPGRLLVSPQLFSVRTLDVPSGLERHYQRFYLNVDREAFDRWLFAAVGSRVCTFPGVTVKKLCTDGNGYTVICDSGVHLSGRFIVGADGASSLVRRVLFPEMRVQRYVSIQERFALRMPNPHFAAFFDPAVTDYYGWGLPKGDEYLVGAAIPAAAGAADKFALFKERLQPFGYDLTAPLRRETTLLLRPEGFVPSGVHASGTACLLGEAGGYVSPSSAEGFSYAFRTAAFFYQSILAARAPISSHSFFPEVCRLHARRMLPLRVSLWGKSLKKVVLYHPALRRLIMRSGVQSLNRIHAESKA